MDFYMRLLILAMALAVSAQASAWVLVQYDAKRQPVYIDRDSITTTGCPESCQTAVWIWTAGKYRDIKAQIEFRREKQFRSLAGVTLKKNGVVVQQFFGTPTNWSSIPPDSILETIYTKWCLPPSSGNPETSTANAIEWQLVGESSGRTVYVDPKSISFHKSRCSHQDSALCDYCSVRVKLLMEDGDYIVSLIDVSRQEKCWQALTIKLFHPGGTSYQARKPEPLPSECVAIERGSTENRVYRLLFGDEDRRL
jgi:hypothetical protein